MKMTEFEIKMIKTFAECDMSLQMAANKLYVHRNTLTYHIEKIKQQTGLDARRFYDLCELLKVENEKENQSNN